MDINGYFLKENSILLKKELSKFKNQKIIVILNPSRKEISLKADEFKDYLLFKKELSENYLFFDFSTSYLDEQDYLDKIHFSHEVGSDILKRIKSENKYK